LFGVICGSETPAVMLTIKAWKLCQIFNLW